MSIDAMKQALEALQAYGAHSSNCDHLMLLTSMPPQRKPCSCGLVANITALRAAIEQAQEPVAWVGPSWMDPKTRTWQNDAFAPGEIEGWTPLYTAPQPAQQPLTDEEIMDACSAEWASHPIEIARAIEAKLREKNS